MRDRKFWENDSREVGTIQLQFMSIVDMTNCEECLWTNLKTTGTF